MRTEPDVADALGDEPGVLPAVVVDADGRGLAPLAELAERARSYARSSKAANTLRAYESDLRHFGTWCDARALTAFPAEPETVALYLVDHAERLAVSTLRRRLAAISEAHQAARFRTRPWTLRCASHGPASAERTARRPTPKRRP